MFLDISKWNFISQEFILMLFSWKFQNLMNFKERILAFSDRKWWFLSNKMGTYMFESSCCLFWTHLLLAQVFFDNEWTILSSRISDDLTKNSFKLFLSWPLWVQSNSFCIESKGSFWTSREVPSLALFITYFWLCWFFTAVQAAL